MDSFTPVHHVICAEKPKHSLVFSIDFEIVELRHGYDESMMRGYNTLPFWQETFDECCNLLGKGRRRVCAYKHNEPMPAFGDTVLEYVSTSSTFTWNYFSETSIDYLPRFYNGWDVGMANKNRDGSESQEIMAHFRSIEKFLANQGLSPIHKFYEPTRSIVDIFTKRLNNKIYDDIEAASSTSE